MEDKLFRIALHWSVGYYKPNENDLSDYHFMINDKGDVYHGKKPPESNKPSSVKAGTYVPHLGGGNSGSIGVSYLSMVGYKNPKSLGPCPITREQAEAGFLVIAKLCYKYNIKIAPDTVFTHYEFGLKNPKSPSGGKIDITFFPPFPEVPSNKIGDFIREKVSYYLNKIISKEIDPLIKTVN